MGVNIFNLIINVYISTVIVAVIAFVLNFRRLDRYYRKQGLQAVFNEDSLHCLLMCCLNTNRKFIGIELDKTYFEIAKKRLEEVKQISFFNT